MSDIFWNTVTEDMRLVMAEFSKSKIAKSFYLTGGTALSLQIGHRLSVDLNFFSKNGDIPPIRSALENSLSAFPATLADSSWGNLVYVTKNVLLPDKLRISMRKVNKGDRDRQADI